MSEKRKDNLIWIDLEMSGLDTQSDYILEIATIVTDKNLNILAEGPNLVINQPDEVLNNMDSWNTNQHGRSGLTEKVKNSDINETEAERQTLKFLEQHAFYGKTYFFRKYVYFSPETQFWLYLPQWQGMIL